MPDGRRTYDYEAPTSCTCSAPPYRPPCGFCENWSRDDEVEPCGTCGCVICGCRGREGSDG